MADGYPKDYSSVYNEDSKPVRSMQQQPAVEPSTKISYMKLDGSASRVTHHEIPDFLKQLYSKLEPLSVSRNDVGINVLNRHYDSVFPQRRKRAPFKVYIQYFRFEIDGNKKPIGDPYVVKVESNILKCVTDKLPNKRGNFRFFFKDSSNACQEIESDHSEVPYIEKDGVKTIYCQVFMSNLFQ